MPAAPVLVPDNSSTMLTAAVNSAGGGHATAGGVHDAVLSNSVVVEDKDGRVDDLGDQNSGGGNRWPRQETLALLKIRSEMGPTFRDSTPKAPLWEDVSRKLSELGYYRSAKKCKEKFENVYKYHRRTKEGRPGKQDGKTYRFSDELEAFDHQNHHQHSSTPPSKRQLLMWPNNNNNNNSSVVLPLSSPPHIMTQSNGSHQNGAPLHTPPQPPPQANGFKPNSAVNNGLFSGSTSSTASDEEFEVGPRDDKKKRKWKCFFRKLTSEVLEKQERLQEKFLEAIAKCERERVLREDAWRREEMARSDKDNQILAQERSSSVARDAAVIAFLHKVTGQQNPGATNNNVHAIEIDSQSQSRSQASLSLLMPPPPPQKALAAAPAPVVPVMTSAAFEIPPRNAVIPPGSSRWPRDEVEQLINLRSRLDMKYQEAGPKGSLWEEISAGMRRLGYNRSAKRCKEKWENINKYYKKVKESCKTRPEDSKTCPYFHQLEILYQQKYNNNNNISKNVASVEKPLIGTMQPPLIMKVQPDHSVIEDVERGNGDGNQEDEDGESTEVDEDRHDDDDDQIEMVAGYKEMEMVESG